jgi:hypothetical protein
MSNEFPHTSKLYEALASQKAPGNHTLKPVYENDLRQAAALLQTKAGESNFGLLFGHKLRDDDDRATSVPLNFGSKSSMSYNASEMLDNEARKRLFLLKKAYSNCEIQAMYKGSTRHPSKALIKSVPLWTTFERYAKSFNITDFDTFIDQVQARFYFEEYEIPRVLADQFDGMPMSSPIVRVPGALGLLEGELEPDDGTFSEQSNTQASYLVESKNNVVHVKITQDLLDDSSPAIIDKLRKGVVEGINRSYERCMLDGDDTVPHMDADTAAGSAKLYSKAWKGLRKRAFDNEVVVGGEEIVFDHNDTPSKDMFSGLLKRLKCQGADKTDLVYILGCSSTHDLVSGAIPELFTAFAFGSIASNRSGIAPPVFGIQVVESQYVREDLLATGKAAAVPATTLTYALLVQKSRFMNWTRQATRVFASPSLPSSDQMLMSGKARHVFDGTPQSVIERSVVMARNVRTV